MIYLDSAALVKLVREEDETRALVTWLNERAGQRLVASVLVEVEVPRALRRSQPGVLGAVAATLTRIDRFELDTAVRATAAAYVDPLLRSLDAIHLATVDLLVASGRTSRRSSPTTSAWPRSLAPAPSPSWRPAPSCDGRSGRSIARPCWSSPTRSSSARNGPVHVVVPPEMQSSVAMVS